MKTQVEIRLIFSAHRARAQHPEKIHRVFTEVFTEVFIEGFHPRFQFPISGLPGPVLPTQFCPNGDSFAQLLVEEMVGKAEGRGRAGDGRGGGVW